MPPSTSQQQHPIQDLLCSTALNTRAAVRCCARTFTPLLCVCIFRKVQVSIDVQNWRPGHRHPSPFRNQQHQQNPQGQRKSKKWSAASSVPIILLGPLPFLFLRSSLPFLGPAQDLDTRTDTGSPLMQQLPYKLYSKLKILYHSDNTIICSVYGLINCVPE